MMRITLIGLLLILLTLPAAAVDQTGSIEILTIPYEECLSPTPGIWVSPRLTLETPFTVTGVVADNNGFNVSIARTWIQNFRMVQWVFGVDRCRVSRFWILLAVGHRLTVSKKGYSLEIVHLWESTPDPYLDEETGEAWPGN